VVVDGSSVQQGKPSPEGFLAAAGLLGMESRHCLVVEDAPAGVAAGLAAGMRVLAVESTHLGTELAAAHELFPSLRMAAAAIRNWVLAARPYDRAYKSQQQNL
jgi:sugar-phosphatase